MLRTETHKKDGVIMEKSDLEAFFKLSNKKFKNNIEIISQIDNDYLSKETGKNPKTAGCYALAFLRLLKGQEFTHPISVDALAFCVKKIEKLYGETGLEKAIKSINLHIKLSLVNKEGYKLLIETIEKNKKSKNLDTKSKFEEEFQHKVAEIYKVLQKNPKNSIELITKKRTIITEYYIRDPSIVATRLFRAKGICEICKNKAPFNRKSTGIPYLEVHHIVPLHSGGKDSIKNTVALCPNCHREAHFG